MSLLETHLQQTIERLFVHDWRDLDVPFTMEQFEDAYIKKKKRAGFPDGARSSILEWLRSHAWLEKTDRGWFFDAAQVPSTIAQHRESLRVPRPPRKRRSGGVVGVPRAHTYEL